MPKDNVIELKKPEPFIDDPITDILRSGARKLLAEALETEIEIFLSQYADLKDDQGRKREDKKNCSKKIDDSLGFRRKMLIKDIDTDVGILFKRIGNTQQNDNIKKMPLQLLKRDRTGVEQVAHRCIINDKHN